MESWRDSLSKYVESWTSPAKEGEGRPTPLSEPAFAGLFCGEEATSLPLSELSSGRAAPASGQPTAAAAAGLDVGAFSAQLAAVLLGTWREVAPAKAKGRAAARKRRREDGGAAAGEGDCALPSSSSLLPKDAVDMLDKIVAILHFLSSDSGSKWVRRRMVWSLSRGNMTTWSPGNNKHK